MIHFMLLAWASLLATQAFAQPQLIEIPSVIERQPGLSGQEQMEPQIEDDRKPYILHSDPSENPLNEDDDLLAPYGLLSGDVVPFTTTTPQSPSLRQWSQAISDHLKELPLEPIDVKPLGVSDLSQPIDIYVLYRDNEPQGFFVRPPDESALEILRQLHEADYKVTVLLSKLGNMLVSSIDHVATDALQKICNASIRPDEFQIELSAGASLFISVGGAVSLTYNLDSLCSQPGVS